MLRFAVPIGTANVIPPQNVKQCYVLRDPHLRFGSYAVEIIITFCVKFLRFGSSSYVLGNVTFCGSTLPSFCMSAATYDIVSELKALLILVTFGHFTINIVSQKCSR